MDLSGHSASIFIHPFEWQYKNGVLVWLLAVERDQRERILVVDRCISVTSVIL